MHVPASSRPLCAAGLTERSVRLKIVRWRLRALEAVYYTTIAKLTRIYISHNVAWCKAFVIKSTPMPISGFAEENRSSRRVVVQNTTKHIVIGFSGNEANYRLVVANA